MPQILNKNVGPIGYGLMGLTFRTIGGNPTEEQAFKAMKAALANGCNYWNGGEFYGSPDNNSLTLLNKYFTKYPEDADKVVLNVKGCLQLATGPETTTAGVQKSVDNCLKLLDGKKFIDIFEPARLDHNVPVEETITALKAYVDAGKIGGIGLSEVRAETIRKAHKIHPIEGGVEVELSLWAQDPLVNGVAEACAELGIPIVAYSPMGHGILAGPVKSVDEIPKDIRAFWPRFQDAAFEKNIQFVKEVEKLAKAKGCTLAQYAIAWSLARTGRPKGLVSIPIPGASSEARVNENSKVVEWTEKDEESVDKVLAEFKVVGERYPAPLSVHLDG